MSLPRHISVTCPILIGRAEQLAALDVQLGQALAGQGGVVLVAGEAGIGKSRLVAEARARAQAAGTRVLVGRCFEEDQSFPYGPVLDLLRAYGAGRPAADLRRALGASASVLAHLIPELESGQATGDLALASDPEQRKRRLFQALFQLVQLAAASAPSAALLLVIEDLHWCDDTSLEWLLALARRLDQLPVLLVLTFRDDEPHIPMRQMLAALDRLPYLRELALGRLGRDELEAMLRAIFGLASRPRADFVEALHALTEGNPLFVEEVLKSLVAAGDIYQVHGEWTRKPLTELRIPRTVQVAVQQRTRDLSEGALALLTLAAVAGQRFDLRVVQAVLRRPEGELLRELRELRAAQLVFEESDELFAFRHALTRQAIYGGLFTRERRSQHLAIAEALGGGAAGQPEARAGELAHHYEEAGLWLPAAEWALRAGAQAEGLRAYGEALKHYARARRCAEALGQSDRLAAIDRSIGAACFASGQYAQAIEPYERALAATAEPAARAALKADLGASYVNNADERGLPFLLEALAELDPAAQAREVATASLWAAFHHHLSAQYGQALAYLERAGRLLDGIDDPARLHFYYGFMAVVLMYAGRFTESLSWSRRDIALGETRGDAQAVSLGYLYLAECSEYLGRWDDTLAFAERGRAFARQAGWASFEVWNELERLVVLYYRGELAEGRLLALSCIERATELDERRAVLHIQKLLVLLEAARGDEEAAQRVGEAAVRAADELVGVGIRCWSRIALAQLHMQREQWGAAAELLERCAELLAGTENRVIQMELGAPLAEVYRALGRLAEAEALIDETLALTRANGARQYEAAAWRARGRLRTTQGRPDEALAALGAAIALCEELGSGLELASALFDRGAAGRAAGDRAAAQADLARARDLCEALGARGLLWRVHAALGQLAAEGRREGEAARAYAAARAVVDALCEELGEPASREDLRRRAAAAIPPEPARRSSRDSFDGLTARERQVAALIAQGCSNREIAGILLLSERTVTTHVSSIFAKLGFSARAQVAFWAGEKGLDHTP